ncbi:hypothetical protein [Streptomyces sp. NBC_01185]|uniref:hypothetical protein n=1 Tax=Streptomyces sp. NBC_01185 TaxID=2903764 RepID=UPI00386BD460|nr:hypothetical protein OG770_00115 [Streptomyces sp. NBC_01185]
MSLSSSPRTRPPHRAGQAPEDEPPRLPVEAGLHAHTRAAAPHVRYTGISLSYQVCNRVFAGFAPVTAVWLSSLAGGAYWPPAGALMVISAIGIWCTLRLRAYRRRRLDAESPVVAPEQVTVSA